MIVICANVLHRMRKTSAPQPATTKSTKKYDRHPLRDRSGGQSRDKPVRHLPTKHNFHPDSDYLYGIQPVLAALTTKKRTFRALFIKTDNPKTDHPER